MAFHTFAKKNRTTLENDQNWFRDWFNSPYYHLLYNNRNFSEAEKLIQNLVGKLNLSANHKVLDLACGKGRHSLSFNQLGLDVIGLDLSPESINEAKELENDRLKFLIGDMRTFDVDHSFDAVFNLFTSFGYFKSDSENQLVINNIAKHLKKDGVLVIDYLNSVKVANQLPINERKKRGEVVFNIRKKIENGFIVKEIQFDHNNASHNFKEFVKYIDYEQFNSYLDNTNMTIVQSFGDYDLSSFNEKSSDRLILVAKKR